MLPLVKGGEDPIHIDPIYWEHEGNAGVRWGKWKLVREYKKPWELYDIDADRAEMRDLSQTNSDKRAEMEKRWTAWASQNDVAFPERFNMYLPKAQLHNATSRHIPRLRLCQDAILQTVIQRNKASIKPTRKWLHAYGLYPKS